MGGIVGRALASHETGAVLEHIMRTGESHLTHSPAVAHVDGLQSAAAPEHIAQVGHLREVEFFQVQACQFIAAVEHVIHARHLAGVQVLQTSDSFKVPHSGEPIEGARRAGAGKRGVKDHLLHIQIGEIGHPTGINGTIVQVVGRTRAATAIVVVVERQRRVVRRVHCIGLLGTGAQSAHHGRHQDDQPKK